MKPYFERAGITIYHGDAREMPTFPADIIITDPPYGIGWKRGVNAARNSKSHDGIANDHDTSARDDVLAMYPNTPAIVFGSFYAPYPARVKQVLVWHKPADSGVVGSTTGHRRDAEPVFILDPWPIQDVRYSSILRSVLGSMSSITSATGHPHTKPVDLMRRLIERAPAGLILDPFMGSGSTLRAAADLGRSAIGIELDERYCDLAARRLQQAVLPMEVQA